MRLLFIALGLFFIIILACTRQSDRYSECLSIKIKDFKSEWKNCKGSSITQYEFNDRIVYVFSTGECLADGGASVYDADCSDVCFLGGLAGFTACEGKSFYEDATSPRVIWSAK